MFYVNFYEKEWVVSFGYLPAAFKYGKESGEKFVVMDEDGYFVKDLS